MLDADYLRKIRDEKKIKRAVIVGGGLIGIELLPQLLTSLDPALAKLVENHIYSKSVYVITANGVAAFLGKDNKLTSVKLQNGTELPCELAVVSIGVQPNSKLAADAGIAIGEFGGISVNKYMQTSDSDIYAAGDCVEINNIITDKKVYAPLGDLANLQGRIVGENVIKGNAVTFPGTIQTSICKIFDFTAGSTSISET